MSISENVKKALYMESAGFYQNPNCNCSLLPFFESGSVTTITELAHIIGQKKHGPRGASALKLSERDTIDNILTLCPTCHTLIDKNAVEFPVELLYQWKKQHKSKVESLFSVIQYKDKESLKSVVEPLLFENQYIFENYGPFSKNSVLLGVEAVNMWNKKVFDKILPNNNKLVCYFKKNETLFSQDKMRILYMFYNHCEEFEYNKISGNKNPLATVFPNEIYEIRGD